MEDLAVDDLKTAILQPVFAGAAKEDEDPNIPQVSVRNMTFMPKAWPHIFWHQYPLKSHSRSSAVYCRQYRRTSASILILLKHGYPRPGFMQFERWIWCCEPGGKTCTLTDGCWCGCNITSASSMQRRRCCQQEGWTPQKALSKPLRLWRPLNLHKKSSGTAELQQFRAACSLSVANISIPTKPPDVFSENSLGLCIRIHRL